MKISEGTLDLGTTDYAVALDPSYTMLEFDSLKVLPVDTGLCDMISNTLQCGSKCTRICKRGRKLRTVPNEGNNPDNEPSIILSIIIFLFYPFLATFGVTEHL